jgi:enoyl-CoA hydratase/carnithine racemase
VSPCWSAQEAADRLRDPAVADLLIDTPLLVIDLRGDDGSAPTVARIPCPVIGLVESGQSTSWPVDLVLEQNAADTRLLADDLDDAAAVLLAAAANSPAASAVLVQVLRATAGLPVEQALAVESLAYSLLLTGPAFGDWLAARQLPRASNPGGLLVRREGSLLELTLDRADVRNAYDAALRDQLVEALSMALVDPAVERVVLRGNGPAFCSGGDLREFGQAADLVAAHAVRLARSPGLLLHQLADRTEVRVHGACVGAGVELPAFAGRVVAAPDAWFRLPELSMGLIPGAGGTVSLPRRIGVGRTLLLALSGLALTATDALRWGLVDQVESDVSV